MIKLQTILIANYLKNVNVINYSKLCVHIIERRTHIMNEFHLIVLFLY